MKNAGMALMCALLVAGCATPPPNTPGAGYGETYTPVIDMQGVDMPRYYRDLTECRRYAGVVDRGNAAVSGAIGGAIIAGALSAILGGNSRTTSQSATLGGFSGLSAMEAKAAGKQERIMGNCMASRGYRVLDSGTVMVPAAAPQQQPQAAPAAVARPIPRNPNEVKAQELARASCTADPRPYSMAGGPGQAMEQFNIACDDGRQMRVRCDVGVCRELGQ